MPEPFEIAAGDGVFYGVGNGLTVTVEDGSMFRRRAIKGIGGTPYRAEWLVAQIGDVKCYVTEGHVYLTRKDLLP